MLATTIALLVIRALLTEGAEEISEGVFGGKKSGANDDREDLFDFE